MILKVDEYQHLVIGRMQLQCPSLNSFFHIYFVVSVSLATFKIDRLQKSENLDLNPCSIIHSLGSDFVQGT